MRRTPHFAHRKIHLNHFIKLSLTVLSDPRWDLPSQMLPAAATRRWPEKGLCSSHSSTKLVFFPRVFFKEVELQVRRRYRFVGRISDLVSTPSAHRPLYAEEWQSSPSWLGYWGKGRQ